MYKWCYSQEQRAMEENENLRKQVSVELHPDILDLYQNLNLSLIKFMICT